MDLIEALGKELYEKYRAKFSSWEIKETIIDEERAFWEIKKPGSIYSKVSLYRDSDTMLIYGDYGRYTFDNMTWLGTPENLRYDALEYQMEKLDFNTQESLKMFDEELCDKQIREWLAKKLVAEWGISHSDAKELVSMNPDKWIMAEVHHWDYFEEDELRNNFKCFCKKENASLEDILEAATDTLSIDFEYDNHTVRVKDYYVCEEMEFSKEMLDACSEGQSYYKSALDSASEYDFSSELKESDVGYRTHPNFYISLVALEVLGEKLAHQREECESKKEENGPTMRM